MKRYPCIFAFLSLVLGCALFLSGCDESSSESRASSWIGVRDDNTDVTPYQVNVVVGAATVGSGGKIPVSISVFDRFGSPVSGAKIVSACALGGAFDDTPETNDQGYAGATLTAGTTAGTEVITVTVLGVVATATVQVLPAAQASPQISVFPAVDRLKPSAKMYIQVYVCNETGVALNEVDVYLHAANGGTFDDEKGETSKGGWFGTVFTAGAAVGQETVTALALGKTASATIAVME